MLFTKGKYKHETGFEIMVTETGDILISPDHPLSLRLSEIFDKNKWTIIDLLQTEVISWIVHT